MSPLDLLTSEAGLAVTAIAVTPDLIAIAATTNTPTAHCPCCHRPSDRVHSRYTRTAADLPWQGRRVLLRVTVRRFRCRTAGCERTLFCERLPAVLTPHARTTDRLTEAHRSIGFALGGEAGSRLAARLALPTSPDTLLRRVKAAPLPAYPSPRVLGVDDFAFRKGTTYGTILIDLERGCVVDLLPDRTADTLAAWLRQHPGIQVISRDRASAYAQAATAAAPEATQVADRFHLMMNVRDAAERVLARHTTLIRDTLSLADEAATPPAASSQSTPEPERIPSPRRQAIAGRRDRRHQRCEQARRMHDEGYSLRAIARALRMSPGTILSYLRTGHVADWRPGRTGPSQLDPFRGHIDRRVGEGCCNARVLHRELRGMGYAGGYDQVRRAIRRRTDRDGRSNASGPIRVPVEIPSARRLSFEVIRRPTERGANATQRLDRLRGVGGVVRTAIDLAEQFAAMVRCRSAEALGEWLDRAASSEAPELRGLARSIRQDEAAVRAGLTERWSNGPVEGRIGRLKLIKRSMYGRAGFALLKARVMNTG